MKIASTLSVSQSQTLTMTSQLQQAIQLLQLSTFELAQFINQQLQENPLLQPLETSDQPSSSEDYLEHSLSRLESEDYENMWHDSPSTQARVRLQQNQHASEDGWHENLLKTQITLKSHLREQIYTRFTDKKQLQIAESLLDMLNDDGYLEGDLQDLARHFSIPLNSIEEILEVLQKFDPPGVFARSLSECLKLQLIEKSLYEPKLFLFLDNLSLLQEGNLLVISKKCQISINECKAFLKLIRSLNPKPGLAFLSTEIDSIIPDVIARKLNRSDWYIELNNRGLPKITIDQNYYHEIRPLMEKEKDKQYITTKFNEANWLLRSLNQRDETLKKVTAAIIHHQQGFFTNGEKSLRPLTLREIADSVNLHESTVSRVTTNKYVATPRGTFELKYFFNSAVSTETTSEGIGAKSIQQRIKTLIAQEDKNCPLSDEQLVMRLHQEGIHIARRTVTKYREALKLGSSTQRRKLNALRECG